MDGLEATKAGRFLCAIRRDMDLKQALFEPRKRNEEVLALSYNDPTRPGGGGKVENLRENALNLPYRYVRWVESQATSKKMLVKVSRDAGAGQKQGGPDDAAIGMWRGIALQRIAYKAGFVREIKAVIAEALARGVSVMEIGYHKDVITLAEARQVGKDAQSVIPEVLQATADLDAGNPADVSAFEAKQGQADEEISDGIAAAVEDPKVQRAVGRTGIAGLLERKASHDAAAEATETDGESPISSSRMIRHRLWMRKRRVGEDVGWDPTVADVEDARFWWERQTLTVAEVKASPLFKPEFKAIVKGYDAWNVSGVARGGQTPSTDNMGSDARQAQSENVLEDDERIVEFFPVWIRRPEMKSGGIRKIVCAEWPDDFCEADDSNPNTDDDGFGLIQNFYPFFDYAPVLPTIPTAERTVATPPISVGMPQFEQIREAGRLVHEAALRSLRIHVLHPALKENKDVLEAIENGESKAFIAPPALLGADGKMQDAVQTIQFTGESPEVERYAIMARSHWVEVMGMPPAVLQGQGTAETLGQDEMGVAAGEAESGAIVTYFEMRTADVVGGLQGLARGRLDDEDWISMLGEEGAAAMKSWQTGTTDDGDEIEVTFGAKAEAQKAVRRKQLMEAITLEKAEIDPVTGLPIYDTAPLFEELHRALDVGKPQVNQSMLAQLQQAVVQLAATVKQLTGGQPGAPGAAAPTSGTTTSGGPNPSEGDGPSNANLGAGVKRGTTSAAGPSGPTETY